MEEESEGKGSPPMVLPFTDSGRAPLAPEEIGLAREITLMDATMLGVGALMGGGVFVLLGLATGVAGPAVLLAFLLNGIATIPTLAIYAELGSASNDPGGGYLWVKEALGQPAGFLSGWISWFAHCVACALYSIAASTYILRVVEGLGNPLPPLLAPFLHPHTLAVLLALFFVILNYVGVKISIRTENAINTVVLGAIAIFLVAGTYAFALHPDSLRNLTPFFVKEGTTSILLSIALAMGITVVAFEGFEIISQASGEIRNPRRNIPRAIWISFLAVWGIMLLSTFLALTVTRIPPSFQGIVDRPWKYLALEKEHALVAVGAQLLPFGGALILGSALLLQLTALNATIYSSSRVSYAMGKDENLPSFFSRIHPRRRTPHLSVLGSGAIILLMALLPIEAVATSTDVMFLLLFFLVNLSYIKLRHTVLRAHSGFRAPLFPLLPLFGLGAVGILAVLLVFFNPVGWAVSVGWVALGLGFYSIYVHPKEAMEELHARRASVVHREAPRERRSFRILVPLSHPKTSRMLARTAGEIAQSLEGEVLLLHVVLVPELTPLEEGRRFAQSGVELLREASRHVPEGVPVHLLVRIGHSLSGVIEETAEEEGASLLLLGWRGTGKIRDWLLGSPTMSLVEFPPCDLAVLRVKNEEAGPDVLIPTHGGAHAPLSIRLGTAIAKARGSRAVLYHVMGIDEEGATGRIARGESLLAHNSVPQANVTLDLDRAPRIVPRVVEKSKDFGLVLVGATTEPLWRNYLFGHKTEEISDRVPTNVLLVKAHLGPAAHRARAITRRLKVIQGYLRRVR